MEKVFLFHVKKQLWRGGKEEKGNMKRHWHGGWVGGWPSGILGAALDFTINRNTCFVLVGNLSTSFIPLVY